MDIRVLRYFLAVARLESITAAAEFLHMSQPPLSRQMKDLEEKLGKQLFVRGSRRIRLTEEGMLLRRRAEEIVDLADRTMSEIRLSGEDISGWVCVGGGETQGMRTLIRILKGIRDDYPRVQIDLFSGNAEEVSGKLERGGLDFGLMVEPVNLDGYDFVRLPATEKWGVLMRRDSPLAEKNAIRPEDLCGQPLLISAQNMVENQISGWMGRSFEGLNVIGVYNLLFNASLLVEEGAGYALCFDGIVQTPPDGPLCFKPLEPKLEVNMVVVWKKLQTFSKPARKFIERLEQELGQTPAMEK